MIDRKSRAILAEKLRQFISGLLTNDEFQMETDEIFDEDAGVRAILQFAWLLYSDCHEHYAEIYGETRDAVARMICFLHTDLEYQWPEYDVCGDVMAGWLNRKTFGLWDRMTHNSREKRFNDFITSGNPDYWPFSSKEQYETAMQNPKLLSGNETKDGQSAV